jgi:hypothetical protein
LIFCFNHARPARAAVFLPIVLVLISAAAAQSADVPTDPAAADPVTPVEPLTPVEPAGAPSDAANHDRILGIIPNFLTVEDPNKKIGPLTAKEKFELFARETFDPFTVVSSAGGAALSQIDNGNPKYGVGAGPYAQRFGAAVADVTTQNFFSDALLSSVLHEDPRYFRRGPEFGIWYRVGYALSRVVVTRTDAGKQRFNYSGMLGMGMGIALSNAYYPDASVSGAEVASRFGTSFAASALGNLLPEFWPDFHQRFFRHRPPNPPSLPPSN